MLLGAETSCCTDFMCRVLVALERKTVWGLFYKTTSYYLRLGWKTIVMDISR